MPSFDEKSRYTVATGTSARALIASTVVAGVPARLEELACGADHGAAGEARPGLTPSAGRSGIALDVVVHRSDSITLNTRVTASVSGGIRR